MATKSERTGLSLVELMIAALIFALLVAVALPSYQHVVQRARAATLVQDLRAVGTLAQEYQVENNEWPGDVPEGVVPSEIENALGGMNFQRPDHVIDWDNWGTRMVGVSAVIDDPRLAAAFVEAIDEDDLFRLGNRYMYVLE